MREVSNWQVTGMFRISTSLVHPTNFGTRLRWNRVARALGSLGVHRYFFAAIDCNTLLTISRRPNGQHVSNAVLVQGSTVSRDGVNPFRHIILGLLHRLLIHFIHLDCSRWTKYVRVSTIRGTEASINHAVK